jgi:DnaJ-domain-containing protein 1
MSLFGRVGVLLRSELRARWGVRGSGADERRSRRRDSGQDRERRRTVGSDARSSAASSTGGHTSVPAQDPTLASYYANLELSYGADIDAVRAARRRLLKRYHPDLHSGDPEKRRTATQLAQGLNRAHDELVGRLDRKQR